MNRQEEEKLEKIYKEIIEFYFRVKELIIVTERLDKEQRLSVAAINEIRSAFDHVARAHRVVLGTTDEKEGQSELDAFQYCEKNFDKAYAHLYRAAYDAYDIISIQLRKQIKEIYYNFTRTIFYQVIPNAREKIFEKAELADDLLKNAKMEKDVRNKGEEKEAFGVYEKGTLLLREVITTLKKAEPEMIRFKEEDKARSKRNIIVTIVAGIISAAVAAILTYLIQG